MKKCFWPVLLFVVIVPLFAFSKTEISPLELLNTIEMHLDQMNLEDIHSLTDSELILLKNIVRLKEPFLKALAQEEGIVLKRVRTPSLYEGVMSFYEYCEKHGQKELAQKLALAASKLLTVRGMMTYTLKTLQENQRLFSRLKVDVNPILRDGDINYGSYFNLLQKMADLYNPKVQSFENDFYKKAREQYQDYATHRELWLELIRATDTVNGEYSKGLKELIRRGEFGKKEALKYFLTESEPALMTRSMVQFYFMRAFAEAYLSLYHGEEGRLKIYFKHLLSDPMMHLNFITFSIAADRTRHLFNRSSAFYKFGMKHPLLAQSILDARPLFIGIFVSDVIFQMVEHPRFLEIWWLMKEGEIKEAGNLFFDLANEVWFRRTFLAKALFSTAVFSGYNLTLHSLLRYGGKKASFSPTSSFIVFTSALIAHDLLLEKINPTFQEWDWQDRLKMAHALVQERLMIFKENLKELNSSLNIEDILSDPQIQPLVEGVYRVELLSLARAFQEKEKEEIRLQTLKEQYPKTTLLLHKLFHLFVSFELLDQVYSGYREFLFRDIYKTMINLQKVFEKQKQELLGETLKRIEKAQQEGKLDLVFQLSMDASLQVF